MTYKQMVRPPTRVSGHRVSFDPSTKSAPTGIQDTQERGRSVTRPAIKPATGGREESRTRPDNRSKGGREASARRPPRQECGRSRLPHKASAASTSRNPPQQCGAAQASTKNPMENLTHHRSQGWKKDLDYFMKAYFDLNHPSALEG